MRAYRIAWFAMAALGLAIKLPNVYADQQSPYGQNGEPSRQGQIAKDAASLLLAKSISETADLTSKKLERLLSELDTAESRQRALLERHRRATQYGNYQHPELRRLHRPMLQGQERVWALRAKVSDTRTLVRTFVALDRSLSALSLTENVVEGGRFLKAAGKLNKLGGATREQAQAYQQTADQVIAQNALYSPTSFMLRLVDDCSPGRAALATCAGLAFNNFSRLVASLAVQEAAIRQMLDSSSEIIASRIQSYGEMGARHAREGRSPGFDSLDRPAIFDVEVLARSADQVITLLDDRSFWVKLFRRSEHTALRKGAEELKLDLAKGEQSSVMAQFRAVYQAAHESASLEMEIQQIDKQMDGLMSEIEELTSLMDRMALELRELMKALEQAEAEDAVEEPEPNESEAAEDSTCEDELDQTFAPYARDTTECDSASEEAADEEDSSASDEPDDQTGASHACRALDRPLPAGLSSTEYCGILQPQPSVQQFQAACEGSDKLQKHTCTVVYCNHVFYHWGAEDIIDCVDKIAAQKDRQAG